MAADTNPAPDSPMASASAPAGSDEPYRIHARSSRATFRAPPWPLSLLGVLLTPVVLTLLAFGLSPQTPSFAGFPGGGWISAYLLFAIPGVVGGLLAIPLASAFGGKFYLRRALFLSLISGAIPGALLVIWLVLTHLSNPFPVEGVILLGFGLVFWLRQLVLASVSNPTVAGSVPAAAVVPALGVALTWAFLGLTPATLVVGVACSLFGLASSALLLRSVSRPMRREFGHDGLALLRPFLDTLKEHDPEGIATVESFFDSLSDRADLRVTVVGFHEAHGKIKTAWLVPSVHPGPFGQLGSSDLPRKAREAFTPVTKGVMVPHSPSTHDLDIPTTPEVTRLLDFARDLLVKVTPGPARGSPLVSPRPGSLARVQILGNTAIFVLTQAPAPTDDIDYALGEMLSQEAARAGFEAVAIIDAHNSYVENRGTIPFGSPQGFTLLRDAQDALAAAKKATVEGPIRVGFAQRQGYTPEDDGLAAEGVTATVVEVAGKKTAYVLYDGNNLVEGLRDPLVKVLRTMVDDGEVMTTDNHAVHEVRGGLNAVGQRRDGNALAEDLKDVVARALRDMEPVRVGGATGRVGGVRVLGPGVTGRILAVMGDSFGFFSLMFPTTFLMALLAGTGLLLWLR